MTTPLKHTVYLVRHGQCHSNITGEKLRPEVDPLTHFGHKQAAALGAQLKVIPFTKAYASTYPRAVQTAEAVLKHQPVPTELKLDTRIVERDHGHFTGRTAKEMSYFMCGELINGIKFNDIEIPEAESASEFVERIESFFKELFKDLEQSDDTETVLVVSHGMLMCRFFAGLNDDTFSNLCTVSNWTKDCFAMVHNTSCTSLTVEFNSDNKPVLTFEKVLSTEHLDGLEDEGHGPFQHPGKHLSPEERSQLIEKVRKTPGAANDIPGCAPV